MYIEDLQSGNGGEEEEEASVDEPVGDFALSDSKRVLIGAGARVLFYPTLLYNVVRNRFQAEFRWWDQIDEFVLLGAVPFPSDVKRLKDIGVCGVITMNEPYETLVPASLYQAHGMNHLVLPTRDYLFAPAIDDISRAVAFIHENALLKRATYVHCKAGRGRSTTVVVCYLMQHKDMLPDVAYAYIKTIRPRVLLAASQWQAVQAYYHLKVKKTSISNNLPLRSSSHQHDMIIRPLKLYPAADLFTFDDGSVVLVTEADLDGYDTGCGSGGEVWGNMSVVWQVGVAGRSALTRLAYLWIRYDTHKISSANMLTDSSCSTNVEQVGGLNVDIHLH